LLFVRIATEWMQAPRATQERLPIAKGVDIKRHLFRRQLNLFNCNFRWVALSTFQVAAALPILQNEIGIKPYP